MVKLTNLLTNRLTLKSCIYYQVLITACAQGIKEVVKNGGTLTKDEPPKSAQGAKGGKGKDKDKGEAKKDEKVS